MAETICAVATAPGEGGIAIVRASGPRAREIFAAAFRPRRAGEIAGRRMTYGDAVDAGGGVLDEAMAVFLAAPQTYTREDMFEIQCHGGGICARRVLRRVIELGARAAEPGEFTRRAFMNGRIDLSRAEAVMSLIGAHSEAAARASLRQLKGGVSGFVRAASEQLKELMSLIEACTDFPDEVEEADAAKLVLCGVEQLRRDILARCDARAAKIVREGASIVLAGRPNVGKSSLMNALLNQERAIVTSVPGTTRDVLTERIRFSGVTAEISDTAGRRETADPIEKIGVDRAERAAADADLLLLVLDGSEPLTDEDRALLQAADARTLVCINKCDRACMTDVPGALRLSAVTGEGMDALLAEITKRLSGGELQEERLTEERHIALAEAACGHLTAAAEALRAGVALDVTEIDLRAALEKLSEITGEDASEEVIDRVFRNFCVGK